MGELYLPSLSHFEHKNIWTGSIANMRYQICTTDQMRVEVWRGPWCYKLSEVELTAEFPVTQEGIEAMRGWIVEQGEIINRDPPATPEEVKAQWKAIRSRQKEQAAT